MTVPTTARDHAGRTRPWLEDAVFGLDGWLRRRNHVFEFSQNPGCIFRIQLDVVAEPVVLSDGTPLDQGARLVNLHLWNEQVPPMGSDGATMAWALRTGRALAGSLRELAFYLRNRPDLADVAAIRGNLRLGTAQQSAQLVRIARHYGFEPVPGYRPRSMVWAVHRFGENILGVLLVMARNPAALRLEVLWRDEAQVFMSRAALDRRYGGGGMGEDD